MSNHKVGVLASGRGSNLQSILDKIAMGSLPLEIAVVISDKADAFALERAEKAGIPNFAVIRKECADKKEFEEKIDAHCANMEWNLLYLQVLCAFWEPILFPAGVIR